MSDRIIMAALDSDGQLTGVGRSRRIGAGTVRGSSIVVWSEADVAWNSEGPAENEGMRHANVVKVLTHVGGKELIAAGAGPDMRRMLEKLGIHLVVAAGPGRAAVDRLAGGLELPLASHP